MATKMQKQVEQVESLDDIFEDNNPLKVTGAKVVSEELIKNHIEKLGESVEKNGEVLRKSQTGLKDSDFKELDQDVNEIVENVKKVEMGSTDYKELVMLIEGIGVENARRNALSTQRLLDRPLRILKEQGSDTTTKVVKELTELRSLTMKLNPNANNLANNTVFGIKLPFGFGKKVDNVLQNFASAKDQLEAVGNNLRLGRDELEADNIMMEEEKTETWVRINEFEQIAYIVENAYEGIAKYVEKLAQDEGNELRVKAIKTEFLYPLAQRRMDVQQDMTLAMNTYLSYQTIAQNNRELIRGVNRSINTALPALQNAIIQSQVLDNQERVVTVVNDVNRSASEMIEQAAIRVEKQGLAIARGATSATLNIDAMKRSSEALLRTIDGVEKFREEALSVMDENVAALKVIAEKSRNGVDKIAKERAGNVMAEMKQEEKLLPSGRKKAKL